jgi:hypothetical protein
MNGRSSHATAAPSLSSGSLSRTAQADFNRRLGTLLLHWMNCRDYWARVERQHPAPSNARSAARAQLSAYTACAQDLEAVMAGKPIPERIGG